MNDLEKLFFENKGYMISKFPHCIEIYGRYLERYRGKEVHLLEIGIGGGGSLFMWKNYLGSKAMIYGADYKDYPAIKDPQIKTFQGNFSEVEFIRSIKAQIPPLDILIDDGSHDSRDQRLILEELLPHVKEEGLYFCEDIHTAYSEAWGGGYHKPESFVEHLKNFIDYLHGYYLEDDPICVEQVRSQQVYALHFYPYFVVIEKSRLACRSAQSPITTGETKAFD